MSGSATLSWFRSHFFCILLIQEPEKADTKEFSPFVSALQLVVGVWWVRQSLFELIYICVIDSYALLFCRSSANGQYFILYLVIPWPGYFSCCGWLPARSLACPSCSKIDKHQIGLKSWSMVQFPYYCLRFWGVRLKLVNVKTRGRKIWPENLTEKLKYRNQNLR